MEAGIGWRWNEFLHIKLLFSGKGKALADFVAGAGGRKKAFVEKKFPGDKAGEVDWTADFVFEFVEVMLPAFTARQSDMRLKGTSFRNEATGLGCRDDTFLKQEQLGREPDSGAANSGALEAAKFLQADRNGRQVQRTQARDDTCALFRTGIAQKLQGEVPGFRRCPSEAVCVRAKSRRGRAEFVEHRGGQGNSDKEAHTNMIVSVSVVISEMIEGRQCRSILIIPQRTG